MSKSRDSVDAIAEAIREDDEAREALAEAVVEQMDLDDSMPEAKGAQAHRRDVLKTLGLLGTGAAAGALGGTAATREARAADTSVGQVGTSGNPVDIALDQIKDDGGDVVADIDDTGDVDFKRGIASPAVTTGQEAHRKFVERRDDTGSHYYDPADHADMGAAIQQALDDLPTSGGTVKIPYGGGDVSSTISVPAGADSQTVVHLIGDAFGAEETESGTLLNSTITDGSPVIEVVGGSNNKSDATYLAHFGITGNGSEGAGIKFHDCQDLGGLYNIGVADVGGRGFWLDNAGDNRYHKLQAVRTGGKGFEIESCSNSIFDNLVVEEPAGDCIKFLNMNNFEFNSGEVDGLNSSSPALSLKDCDNWKVGAGVSCQNASNNAMLLTDCKRGQIIGGTYRDCDSGIKMFGSTEDITIRGAEIKIDQNWHIRIPSDVSGVTIKDVADNGGAQRLDANATATDIIDYDKRTVFNGDLVSSPGSAEFTVNFDTAFTIKPMMLVNSEGAAFESINGWQTDGNGNFNAVDLKFGATPNFVRWMVEPRT